MATSSSSYLQTLPPNEATAFVASLQKVREHLTQELQWMTEQVQQKTIQLRGLEAILAETDPSGSTAAQPERLESKSAQVLDTLSTAAPSAEVSMPIAESNGTAADIEAVMSSSGAGSVLPGAISASLSELSAVPPKFAKTKGSSAKPKGKTSNAKPKKKAVMGKKSSTVSGGVELRQLLVDEFKDKTFGEAVIEILADETEPLHIDDLLAEMYGDLPDADFKRAKGSLANVLSVGTKKGSWNSLGKGLYSSNGSTSA